MFEDNTCSKDLCFKLLAVKFCTVQVLFTLVVFKKCYHLENIPHKKMRHHSLVLFTI